MTNRSDYDNWMLAVLALYESGGLRQGEVNHAEVQHDDWCDLFAGGRCNCDPVVVTGPAVDRKYRGGGR